MALVAADSPPPALLAFALNHAQITGFIGSRQHTSSNHYRLPQRTLTDYNLIYLWEGQAEWIVDGVAHQLNPAA